MYSVGYVLTISLLHAISLVFTVQHQLQLSFKCCPPSDMYIRFGLMVGIGGDVPGKDADIWLGEGDFGGVVQYDFGKTVAQVVFERTGRLNRPPQILLTAISRLQADQVIEASQIPKFLSEMTATYPRMTAEFTYRGRDQDRLLMPHQTTMGWIMLAIIVK
jgi:hypothetical protein